MAEVALVTGGETGTGKAIALALEAKGFEVRSASRRTGWDLLDRGAIDRLVNNLPRIDLLVNNAGIAESAPLAKTTDDLWDRHLALDVTAPFLLCRAALPLLRMSPRGRIINIASTAGAIGNPGQVNYSAAKAGVIGLTKAAARELAHWNILVNAVAPGLIETDMAAAIPAEAREALLQQVPLKRIGEGREVAEVVRFLAGEGASYITGQTIHVNGGLYA